MDRCRQLATPLLAIVLLAAAPTLAGDFVGIADWEFASHYRAQRATEWCWASCVEMALSWEGIAVSQESIVAGCLGKNVNLGGEPADMVASTNGIFRTETGAAVLVAYWLRFEVQLHPVTKGIPPLIRYLQQWSPEWRRSWRWRSV